MKVVTPRFSSHGAQALIFALLLAVLTACGGGAGSSAGTSSTSGNPNGGSPPPTGSAFLYTGDIVGIIHGFSIDPNSGRLTSIANAAVPVTNIAAAGFVQLVADPSGKALYASSAGVNGPNVVAFTVDSNSGALNAVAANQALAVPAGKMAVDPKGTHLYVIPDPSADTAAVFGFSIDPATHGLTQLPSSPTALPGLPHDITVDPSGKFVYVTFAGTPGQEIAGFSRDASTGTLSKLSGSPFANVGGDSPQGIRVTPNGEFVIVANQATSNVSVLSIAPGTGALTSVAGAPFVGGEEPEDVTISSDGKFVFVADVGGNTLSAYTINAAGALTRTEGTPVPLPQLSQPGSVGVDPSDKFVFVSTTPRSAGVVGFSLDSATGALTPIPGSPFPVGQSLRGLIVLKP